VSNYHEASIYYHRDNHFTPHRRRSFGVAESSEGAGRRYQSSRHSYANPASGNADASCASHFANARRVEDIREQRVRVCV